MHQPKQPKQPKNKEDLKTDTQVSVFLYQFIQSKSLLDAGEMVSATGALNLMKLGLMEGEISKKNVMRIVKSH